MSDVTLSEASPRVAVLDPAHIGDIEGAFGTIYQGDVRSRHTWSARLRTLAAIAGPGLIVMVGDNDAGALSTYAQAGQNYGTTLLWTLLLLVPVLYVNQEMVLRLGNWSTAAEPTTPASAHSDRATWRMPPLDELQPANLSLAKRVWMGVLGAYLIAAAAMVAFEVVQVATGF